jgi:DNA-directed RNA polymerase
VKEAIAEVAQDNTEAAEASKNEATFGDKPTQAIASTEAKAEVKQPDVEKKETPDAKNVVPEKYDLKAPDGSLLSDPQLEALAAYAKEQKLTNEQAQLLVNREHQQKQQLAAQAETWKADASSDKEIGGAEFSKNSELAKRVLAKFGNPTINKFLDDSGFGNHPDALRLFVKLGKAMSEDTLVLPGAQASGKVRVEDLFYPPKAAE